MLKQCKRLFREDLKLSKWARTGYIPNYDEYMEVGIVTAGIDMTVAFAFIGMGEAGKEAFDWIRSRPKFIQTLDIKGRLRDDVATYKVQFGIHTNHIYLFFRLYNLQIWYEMIIRMKWLEERLRQESTAI